MKILSPLPLGIALFGMITLSSCNQATPIEEGFEALVDDFETQIEEELDSLSLGDDTLVQLEGEIPPKPVVPKTPREPIDPIPDPGPGPLPPIWDPIPEPPIEEEIVEVLEPVQEDRIYDITEVQAEFPGGEKALFEYVANNVVYPQEDLNAGNQGRVYVQFVVEKDGSITNIKVLRGVSAGLDKEAKRVIRNMPKWKPAEQNGKTVRSRMTLPITFRLD